MVIENTIPEMVGRIGRNAAVENNDQIAAAVAQAVYNAIVSVMSSSGNQNGKYI